MYVVVLFAVVPRYKIDKSKAFDKNRINRSNRKLRVMVDFLENAQRQREKGEHLLESFITRMWTQDLMQDKTMLVALVVCIFTCLYFFFFFFQKERRREPLTTNPLTTNPPTTNTITLDDADTGGGGTLLVKITPSLALHLSCLKRADLLRRIFSFHKTKNPKHYINLRSSSKLFHRALHQPPPLWTTFPHSNHATLQSLVNRLEELQGDEESSGNVPSVLLIDEGAYCGVGNWYVTVKKPLSIYGAGRGKTFLVGLGLKIKGNKSDGIVEIEELTIKGAEGNGLFAEEGMNVIMRGCSIEDCKGHGVAAQGHSFPFLRHLAPDISCDDLQVVGCGLSGVCVSYNATITLSGQGTSIHGNVITTRDRDNYGLYASSSSKINLVLPLTKEKISTNNGGGRNWGGNISNIKQVSK